LLRPTWRLPGVSKTVAILQSNYIPWKGYFDLIHLADEFILFDDAQYAKNDWRNRNTIKSSNGLLWLTIPVRTKGAMSRTIQETTISDLRWNRRHWHSIRQYYARARYFREYKPFFEELYLASTEERLSQVSYCFLKAICGLVGIGTRISWSRDYRLVEGKTERLVSLCTQAGATTYLSGPSAKAYLDEDAFRTAGIAVRYMDYSGYPEYRQLFPPFEHRVSIVDLILNEGPDSTRYMKSF
jgi:hypothetical protein